MDSPMDKIHETRQRGVGGGRSGDVHPREYMQSLSWMPLPLAPQVDTVGPRIPAIGTVRRCLNPRVSNSCR